MLVSLKYAHEAVLVWSYLILNLLLLSKNPFESRLMIVPVFFEAWNYT